MTIIQKPEHTLTHRYELHVNKARKPRQASQTGPVLVGSQGETPVLKNQKLHLRWAPWLSLKAPLQNQFESLYLLEASLRSPYFNTLQKNPSQARTLWKSHLVQLAHADTRSDFHLTSLASQPLSEPPPFPIASDIAAHITPTAYTQTLYLHIQNRWITLYQGMPGQPLRYFKAVQVFESGCPEITLPLGYDYQVHLSYLPLDPKSYDTPPDCNTSPRFHLEPSHPQHFSPAQMNQPLWTIPRLAYWNDDGTLTLLLEDPLRVLEEILKDLNLIAQDPSQVFQIRALQTLGTLMRHRIQEDLTPLPLYWNALISPLLTDPAWQNHGADPNNPSHTPDERALIAWPVGARWLSVQTPLSSHTTLPLAALSLTLQHLAQSLWVYSNDLSVHQALEPLLQPRRAKLQSHLLDYVHHPQKPRYPLIIQAGSSVQESTHTYQLLGHTAFSRFDEWGDVRTWAPLPSPQNPPSQGLLFSKSHCVQDLIRYFSHPWMLDLTSLPLPAPTPHLGSPDDPTVSRGSLRSYQYAERLAFTRAGLPMVLIPLLTPFNLGLAMGAFLKYGKHPLEKSSNNPFLHAFQILLWDLWSRVIDTRDNLISHPVPSLQAFGLEPHHLSNSTPAFSPPNTSPSDFNNLWLLSLDPAPDQTFSMSAQKMPPHNARQKAETLYRLHGYQDALNPTAEYDLDLLPPQDFTDALPTPQGLLHIRYQIQLSGTLKLQPVGAPSRLPLLLTLQHVSKTAPRIFRGFMESQVSVMLAWRSLGKQIHIGASLTTDTTASPPQVQGTPTQGRFTLKAIPQPLNPSLEYREWAIAGSLGFTLEGQVIPDSATSPIPFKTPPQAFSHTSTHHLVFAQDKDLAPPALILTIATGDATAIAPATFTNTANFVRNAPVLLKACTGIAGLTGLT